MGQINDYYKTYEILKNIYDLYNKYEDKEQFFLYLNDKMCISNCDLTCLYDNLRNYIGTIDILCNEEDFMITLIKCMPVIVDEYKSFCQKYFSCKPHVNISNCDKEKMNYMFDLIDSYMNEKSNFYSLIYNLVKKNNILYDDLRVYAKYVNSYCYDYNTKSVPNFKMKSVYNFRKMYDLYRKILTDSKFVVDLCKGNNEKFVSFTCYVKVMNGVTPKNLNRSLSYFKNDDDVKKFIDKYYNYYSKNEERKHIQKQNEYFEHAYIVIRNYIDGNYKDIKEYCSSIKSAPSTIESYVGLMKEANDPIYVQYCNLENTKNEANLKYMHNCIDTVLSYIRNGIEEDGAIRKFNLLDYYSYTNVSFKELKNSARKYLTDSKDLTALSLFISKYEDDKIINEKNINEIFDIKDIILCEFDSDGNITNPGYEITADDKKEILRLLNEKNIPLTVKTYSLMRDRYIQKEILEKYNKNTIKR